MHSVSVSSQQGDFEKARKWQHLHKYMWPRDLEDVEIALGLQSIAGKRYVEKTEVSDIIYFPGNPSSTANLSIALTFEDGMGLEHRVKLAPRAGKDTLDLMLPLPLGVVKHRFQSCREIQWHGSGVTKRTCVDARSTIVKCTFQYEPRTLMHCHGVRIKTTPYELEFEKGNHGAKGKDDLATWEMKYWKVISSQAMATIEDGNTAWTYSGLLRRAAEPNGKSSKKRSTWKLGDGKELLFSRQQKSDPGSGGQGKYKSEVEAVERSLSDVPRAGTPPHAGEKAEVVSAYTAFTDESSLACEVGEDEACASDNSTETFEADGKADALSSAETVEDDCKIVFSPANSSTSCSTASSSAASSSASSSKTVFSGTRPPARAACAVVGAAFTLSFKEDAGGEAAPRRTEARRGHRAAARPAEHTGFEAPSAAKALVGVRGFGASLPRPEMPTPPQSPRSPRML